MQKNILCLNLTFVNSDFWCPYNELMPPYTPAGNIGEEIEKKRCNLKHFNLKSKKQNIYILFIVN